MGRQLLYNALIVNEGRKYNGYVVIDGDKIAAVGENDPSDAVVSSCGKAEDLRGALLIPGVIDDQVHFREPGLTHKADIASESRAAVAGGACAGAEAREDRAGAAVCRLGFRPDRGRLGRRGGQPQAVADKHSDCAGTRGASVAGAVRGITTGGAR